MRNLILRILRRFRSRRAMNEFPKNMPGCRLYLNIANQKLRQFQGKRPSGVTVHYAADVRPSSVIRALETNSLGYHILIEPDGGLIQLARLDRSVAHAGKAQWNGKSPNRCHLSFCLLNWGWLEQHGEDFKSWAGAFVLGDNAKTGKDITGKKRFWHSVTPEQFNSLVRISKWAMAHGISPDDVCGHDEAALPLGRKLDPGGVLPCSMHDFRELLRNEKENSEKPEISSIH